MTKNIFFFDRSRISKYENSITKYFKIIQPKIVPKKKIGNKFGKSEKFFPKFLSKFLNYFFNIIELIND